MKKIYYTLALAPLLTACSTVNGLWNDAPTSHQERYSGHEYSRPEHANTPAAKKHEDSMKAHKKVASSQNGSAMQVEPVKKAKAKKPAPIVPLKAPGMAGSAPTQPATPAQPVPAPTPSAPTLPTTPAQ